MVMDNGSSQDFMVILYFYHVLVFTNEDLSEYYKQTKTFEKYNTHSYKRRAE